LVAVSDTGRGIAEEHLPHIFERSYQVKAADSSKEEGLGLGLFIAQELVRLHAGNIWVESAPGKGSTFSFVLPKRQLQRSTTVLVVDDDDDVVEFGRRALETAGFTVLTALDGAQALESMRRVVPNLVVLDLRLPTMDGPTVLREIRKGWGDLPVVIYTGYPDSDLLTEAMRYSPITLLAKPCSDNRFVNTVRDLLWRQEHPTSTEGHRELQPIVPTIATEGAGSSPVASVEASGEQH
jgi:two-component system cell cycle sensor histidine kinase/response regulator CckA